MDNEFSKRLMELRKKHGYSQERLGELLFVSRQAVSKWECGEAVPDIDNLTALAKLYNVSLDELVDGKPTAAESEATAESETTENPDLPPAHSKAYLISSALLILAPLIILFIWLPFLPDTIPAHYDIAGNVDRFGSKYELFLFAAINPIAAATICICGAVLRKTPSVQAQKKTLALVFFITCEVTYLACCVLTVVFTAKAARIAGTEAPDFYVLIAIVNSCVIMLMGAVVPFAKPNLLIGIRTAATLGDPVLWRKVNIVAGVVFLACGVGLNIFNMLYQNGMTNIIVSAAVTVAACGFCIFLPKIFGTKKADKE